MTGSLHGDVPPNTAWYTPSRRTGILGETRVAIALVAGLIGALGFVVHRKLEARNITPGFVAPQNLPNVASPLHTGEDSGGMLIAQAEPLPTAESTTPESTGPVSAAASTAVNPFAEIEAPSSATPAAATASSAATSTDNAWARPAPARTASSHPGGLPQPTGDAPNPFASEPPQAAAPPAAAGEASPFFDLGARPAAGAAADPSTGRSVEVTAQRPVPVEAASQPHGLFSSLEPSPTATADAVHADAAPGQFSRSRTADAILHGAADISEPSPRLMAPQLPGPSPFAGEGESPERRQSLNVQAEQPQSSTSSDVILIQGADFGDLSIEPAPAPTPPSAPAAAPTSGGSGFDFEPAAAMPKPAPSPPSGFDFAADAPPAPTVDAFAPRPNPAPAELFPSDAISSSAIPLEQPAAAPPIEVAGEVHVVQPGDNFWSMSRQHYRSGRYFAALAEFNRARIPNPNKMKPGMKVIIPPVEALEMRYAKLISGGSAASVAATGPATDQVAGFFVGPQGEPLYRTGKNDTLSGIAQNHLGRASRWVQVFGMNRDQMASPDALKIGMVLRLPQDASRVSLATDAPTVR